MENIKTLSKKSDASPYTKGEEIFNFVTHAIGVLLGAEVLAIGIVLSAINEKKFGIPASIIYGGCMIVTYTVSSVYHGLSAGAGKRVLRVMDHCAIYLLIIGAYAGITLTAILPYSPPAAVAILSVELALGAAAILLTAVNMRKFVVASMVCYIALGWCILAVPHIALGALGSGGFLWLLFGGIAYTIGSVLYGIGRKKRYSARHVPCVLHRRLGFAIHLFRGLLFLDKNNEAPLLSQWGLVGNKGLYRLAALVAGAERFAKPALCWLSG